MDGRQLVAGIVIFLVFWAFQAKFSYISDLGTTAWFLGAVIFSVLLWFIGKGVMPKPSASQKELWNFTIVFALAVTFIVSFVAPYIPGIVIPSGDVIAIVTPILLSLWLVVFGAAMFVTGWETKWGVTLMTGLIWLISSLTWVANAGPNAWLHFAIIAGFPFIIYGLIAKGR